MPGSSPEEESVGPPGARVEVECFRCGLEGTTVARRDPFRLVRCPRCRQEFVSPRTVGQDAIYEGSDYFENMNVTNRAATAVRRLWLGRRIAMVRRALAQAGSTATDPRLLEIGVSWGEFLELARVKGFSVAGSEFSPGAAEHTGNRLGLPVQPGPFDADWFLDGPGSESGAVAPPFDVVCFWDVIEHTPDPAAFLREVSRVSHSTSVIGFSCPNVGSPAARLAGGRWWTLKPDEHLWHFTPDTIGRLFADAGWEVVALHTSPVHPSNLLRFDSLVGAAVRRSTWDRADV